MTGERAAPSRRPEFNPVEYLWDVAKGHPASRVFPAPGRLEPVLSDALRPFWTDPACALARVGNGWLHSEANASQPDIAPLVT